MTDKVYNMLETMTDEQLREAAKTLTPAEKGQITKDIKHDEEHLNDLKKAYESDRWLHGERVTLAKVHDVTNQLRRHKLLRGLVK